MASSSVYGARDDADYSASTTRASSSRRVPLMESFGARVGSSEQVLPLDAPSSLLRLLVGLYMVRRRSFAANDIQTGAAACCPTASFVANDLKIYASNACCRTAPSVMNDNQKGDADLCPSKAGVLPLNTRSSLLCIFLGFYIMRRWTFEANEIRTGVGNACCPTIPFLVNELQICAACPAPFSENELLRCAANNACYSTASPVTNDKQDADPSPRAGVLPLNTPFSLLCLLLGIYIVQGRSFEANDIRAAATNTCYPSSPFATNDIRTGAATACYQTALSAENNDQQGNVDPSLPTALFTAYDMKPGANDPWVSTALSVSNGSHPSAANSICTATVIRKIFMVLCFGRLQVSEERTLAPPNMYHQFLLPIPLIAAVSKVPNFWRRLGCWAMLSSVMAITGQGAILFKWLSTILSQSGFMTRLCGYIVKRFGYEGRIFVRAAEFVDLVSTFFRHTSSSLKSASDILSIINAFHSSNGSSSESVSLDDESNVSSSQEIISANHTGVQCVIVSSISEGKTVISQWKTKNAQVSVDVPSTMPLETARELKKYFAEEGAIHLLNGPIINAILEKALLQGSSLPLLSPSTDTCHDKH